MESTLSLSSSNIPLIASNNHVDLMRMSRYKIKKSVMRHKVYNCKSVGIGNNALKPISSSASVKSGPYHSYDQKDFVVDMHMHHDRQGGLGILDFLRGKTFLVTGATGFLGKVLIEKILRAAPDVDKIFVLIKAKDKEAAEERLKNEIIGAEVFRLVKQIHGKSYQAFMLSKLVPLVGDLRESNLGLDQDATQFIATQVDIIINSAANTTFDERYDTALDINTSGVMRIMGFAKQCRKLKLFLHVSTAYVNGQRQGRIMEKPLRLGQCIQEDETKPQASTVLLPKLSVEDEINSVLGSKRVLQDSSLLQKMKKLGTQRAKTFGWQDTYSFTKAMGEMMIDSVRGDIPVVVIRPSVIESTYKEPFPGWIEGNRMIDPVITLYGKGYLTGFLADPNAALDIVPADMVVNAILAAMSKHGGGAEISNNNNIYHVASSVANPVACGDLFRYLYKHFSSSPFIDSKGNPVCVAPVKFFNSLGDFSADLRTHAISRGPSSNLVTKSVEYLANIYQPYAFYGGRFDNSSTKMLMGCMSEEERREFGFDVESIDWEDYITNVHIPGLRRHAITKG